MDPNYRSSLDQLEDILKLADPVRGLNDQVKALGILADVRKVVTPGSSTDLRITGLEGVVKLWQGKALEACVLFSHVLLIARAYHWHRLEESARFWLPLAQRALNR